MKKIIFFSLFILACLIGCKNKVTNNTVAENISEKKSVKNIETIVENFPCKNR